MNIKTLLYSIFQIGLILLVAVFIFGFEDKKPEPQRPNVIVIMPDDAGYGDYASLGNPIIRTPSVDAFKKESLLFTQFHVSPKCSPTRAALLGGRHEFKSGVTHTVFERERLSLQTVTIADMLKGAGYATGIFGKWHLGDEKAYRPENRGFDEVYSHGGGGIGQTFPGSCGDAPGNSNIDPVLWHNGKWVKTTGYSTDLFFDQAIKWMDTKRKEKKPFFAYIPLNAAHGPYVVPEKYYKQYLGKPGVDEQTAKFFGMIENIDTNFGKMLGKLEEMGIDDNTLVIFLGSDNGGTKGVKIFNAGMKGGKGSPYQGGTRVPCFVRWPAGGIQGGVETDALTAHLDIFPTLAELAGVKLSGKIQSQIDGINLVPLFKNPNGQWPDRTLVHHFGNWAQGDAAKSKYRRSAIQNSRFSLVNNTELYDIKADPGETKNIIDHHPLVVKKLRALYDQWWEDVQPLLVNENLVGPKVNPMKETYWEQFGGGPDEQMLRRMDPANAVKMSREIAARNESNWKKR
ncbi:MAG: arylsulfatase [Muricauda sp.]|nr:MULTISPECIES: arylsulfatase [unclassified Allomuricauda]MAU17013.1 arylsulfatase [Allomuricauda sp.]|tara:strand:+ start:2065 stop:3606 length:1542 start_codon:yes stop_codon:yes gene_type:complete